MCNGYWREHMTIYNKPDRRSQTNSSPRRVARESAPEEKNVIKFIGLLLFSAKLGDLEILITFSFTTWPPMILASGMSWFSFQP